MTSRSLPIRRAALLLLAISFGFGGCSSGKSDEQPPAQRAGVDTSTPQNLAGEIVGTLSAADRKKFESFILPPKQELVEYLKKTAKADRRESKQELQLALLTTEVILEFNYNRIRQDLVDSWTKLRRQLTDAGVDWKSLTLHSANTNEFNRKKQFNVRSIDQLRIAMADGDARYIVTIDNCVLVNGTWIAFGPMRLDELATSNLAKKKD